ncbi:MAG: aspartate kinase [Candidatus Aenigmarchaeota archaeon]|nr:aspartate kinase [Candidatus Aenigmarchaeota archaeon]
MMKSTVLKFGGTSVETIEKIEQIAKQIKDNFSEEKLFVVVSAMGNTTDRIEGAIKNAKEKLENPEDVYREFELAYQHHTNTHIQNFRDSIYQSFHNTLRKVAEGNKADVDRLHVTGERLSALLFHTVLNNYGIDSQFIDFWNPSFPLAVEGSFSNATLNLSKSMTRAKKLKNSPPHVTVFPGYGGMDGNFVKTLGRGGSDTAAFGYAYAFGADSIIIGTDVDGLKSANVESAEIVKEVDIKEASAIAFLGAKFPSDVALTPLEAMYDKGLNPYVCVANSQNLLETGTRIVKETSDRRPVKVIAGRNIATYVLEGDLSTLVSDLYKSGIDWFSYGLNRRFLRLGISERTSEDAERKIEEYRKNRKLKICEYDRDVAIVGMVGCGMKYQTGVGKRASSALTEAGINILTFYDPSDVSIGMMIERGERDKAINVLYNEFIR